VTPEKVVGKEVHVNLIAVVGVAPTIPIITLVAVAVNMTSIVPLGAADARVQGVREASRLLAIVGQPNKQIRKYSYRNKTENQWGM
jgi:hypothetical protein